MKHLESLMRLTAAEILEIFRISSDLKRDWSRGVRPRLLEGRVLTLLFEKPSLRTRISMEAAIAHLGGASLFLTCAEAGLGGREALPDVARVLASYSDWIVMRTFSHSLVEEFVKIARCPIINGLSDQAHPCQALADLFTIQEALGELSGRRVVFVGDGNNVARSLAVGALATGMKFTLSSPAGYEFTAEFMAKLKAKFPQGKLDLVADPVAAVSQADIIYTDVWASMGQEAEVEKRRAAFAKHQVNGKLMAAAPSTARFMHCLPARRGQEVTDDVMDGKASLAFPQAENRMHVSKGILLWTLGLDSHS